MTTRGFSKDNAQTVVSNGGSAISSGATSVPVSAATNFPSSGVYCVKTPSGEVMQITGGQGTTTWTVVRGVGGTAAASIPDGATLKEVLSSEDMKLMAQLSDSRFTDSRTPTAHASSHASGGSDAITVADALITAVSASKLTGSHTLPDGTLSTNVPLLNVDNTFTGKVTGTAFIPTGLTGSTATGRWVGFTASGAPTTGPHLVGDVACSLADGAWYTCTVAGTPGTWVTPSSGSSSLTTASSSLSADVTMTSGATWYDGPTISCVAGTWLLFTHINMEPSANVGYQSGRIWDGTTTYASADTYVQAGQIPVTFTMVALVTPGSTTTYRAACMSGSASAHIKAALVSGGVGNNASTIVGVKVG